MDIFILLFNKTAARFARIYLINTLCSVESDELEHKRYIHYILIQKQYDISGSLLCNPGDFYYLHYILIQK